MTSRPAATLQARYVEQAAADLAENRRRQQDLAEQIAVLRQEEALLADILQLAERYEGFADASRLPEQLHDEPAAPRTGRASSAAVSPGPATGRGTAASSAGKPGKAAKPGKPGARADRAAPAAGATDGAKTTGPRPLLGDLLADLLGGHDEPRLAKELREELMAKHADRSPTPQVVRNTLESLVAKGRIRRHKQQRSVMYTLAETDRPD